MRAQDRATKSLNDESPARMRGFQWWAFHETRSPRQHWALFDLPKKHPPFRSKKSSGERQAMSGAPSAEIFTLD